ncbi:hypothetical protein [Rhodoferax antarcticus]|uniref:hypothetical protein n=1 Tax=Rhodoferax antarcticus TaxID=81479 RepID=UPI000958B397|nr:hypothetical protein [Rhodoferax antarcticus]APW48615.1 hypothetical protein RA876_19260 [Rhodoferax antarcticus]
MLIFLDTEFTQFNSPDLISMALVAEDGREFYAERDDYHRDDCSDFVRETVLPLLGRVPGATCSRSELTDRVREWFAPVARGLPRSFLTLRPYGGCWVSHAGAPAKEPPQSLAQSCTLIAVPSRTRSSSRHKAAPTRKNGPCTMRWPMRGR